MYIACNIIQLKCKTNSEINILLYNILYILYIYIIQLYSSISKLSELQII